MAVHIAVFHFLGNNVAFTGDLLGGTSVSPFIMLTGFTAAVVYGSRPGQLDARKFFKSRAARVMPLYWVLQFVCLPLLWLRPRETPRLGGGASWVEIVIRCVVNALGMTTWTAGFFPSYVNTLNPAAWTICTFIMLWLGFPAALRWAKKMDSPRLWRLTVGLHWAQVLVYSGSYAFFGDLLKMRSGLDVDFLVYQSPYGRAPLFLFGVVAGVWRSRLRPDDVVHVPRLFLAFTPTTSTAAPLARAVRAGDRRAWAAIADASAALWCLVLFAVFVESWRYDYVPGGPPGARPTIACLKPVLIPGMCWLQFATLLALTLDGRTSRLSRLCVHPATIYLGKCSMALYLVHMPVFRYLTYFQNLHRGKVPVVWLAYWFGLSSALSIALYEYVEEPARRRLSPSRRVAPAPPPAPPP